MPLDISKLNTKARRNLKEDKLFPLYTDKELEALLCKSKVYEPAKNLSQVRWSARFEDLRDAAHTASPKKIRKWSPEEDTFLRSTYQYLTDNTIALALNIPANIVRARRIVLKLSKAYSNKLDIMVWCERDNFERDISSARLLKARPDVIL